MPAKLCQLLAVEKNVKTTSNDEFTQIYHVIQKPDLAVGFSKTYQPNNDEGERFPPEEKQLQLRVTRAYDAIQKALSPLFDHVATRDAANLGAKADVVVDGKVLLKDVPAVTLLFLEKQLVDFRTVITKLPELSPDEVWHRDDNMDCYATKPVMTVKTKKIPRPFVKAPATEQHPAQVEVVHDDVQQGNWTTIKYSGALARDEKHALRTRCEELIHAVKYAREEANKAPAPPVSVAKEVFAHLFG